MFAKIFKIKINSEFSVQRTSVSPGSPLVFWRPIPTHPPLARARFFAHAQFARGTVRTRAGRGWRGTTSRSTRASWLDEHGGLRGRDLRGMAPEPENLGAARSRRVAVARSRRVRRKKKEDDEMNRSLLAQNAQQESKIADGRRKHSSEVRMLQEAWVIPPAALAFDGFIARGGEGHDFSYCMYGFDCDDCGVRANLPPFPPSGAPHAPPRARPAASPTDPRRSA